MANQLTPNNPLIQEIRELVENAEPVWHNRSILNFCPLTGRLGVRLWNTSNKASTGPKYGKQALKELSKELTKEFGKGFSVSNIQFMRRFYQTYINSTDSVC